NVKAIKLDARNLKEQGQKFDKILVDAPCSGYGVLRKKPEALYNKTMVNVNELAALQTELLNSAAAVLKVGGEMVYSTCTIFSEENTDNAKKFLENHKNFSVVKIELPENVNGHFDSLGGFLIDYTEEILDNFYIIKLRKDFE
ncbi:MAG: 16S rRNA (cytosine(967)-C(5))-methyltransferase RsmB, partial [Cetobacterium sp.]